MRYAGFKKAFKNMVEHIEEYLECDCTVNQEKIDFLLSKAKYIDKLVEDTSCPQINFALDKDNSILFINLTCSEIVVDTLDHAFYKVADGADELNFNKGTKEDDTVEISFAFYDFWTEL